MTNTLVQFCSETLSTQPSVRYARFQHWICSGGSTGEHNLSKKAARWNFQFDIGKQRRNTLFESNNLPTRFGKKHVTENVIDLTAKTAKLKVPYFHRFYTDSYEAPHVYFASHDKSSGEV